MGPNLFQRRGKGDAASSEFASTVQTPPPDLRPAPGDSLPADTDSTPGPSSDTPPYAASDLGADSLPAPTFESAVDQRPTLSHIGRYALKGLIGQGGLGQVHEAWDPLLSRTVAIKTLQFNLATPARVSLDGLFLNEARAAAGLSHPHIVTVHDAGLSAHGVYIAMERLYGRDLRERLALGWQPTPAQAARLVRRVADALSYAHVRGVVHCDIKPANIFLNRRDKPKVLDFGIARVAHGAVGPVFEGAVAGSPHYLAPEQLEGGSVDARTDVHALGVVFYELLTLRKAYGGESIEQITTAVRAHHPAPAHEVRDGVPRRLSAIAAKAMAREPAARYATAAEMASDLRRWLDQHPEVDATPADAEPASVHVAGQATLPAARRASGRRLPAAAWLVVLLLVVAGLGGGLAWRSRQAFVPSNNADGLPSAPAPATQAGPATQAPSPGASPGPSAATPGSAASSLEGAMTPVDEPATTGPAVAAGRLPAASAVRPALRVTARSRAANANRDAKPASPPEVTAPASGELQLAISPWGEVDVDGKAAGTTPPLTRLTLPEGMHTITVRNDDAPAFTATVQVSADHTVTVRHRFGP